MVLESSLLRLVKLFLFALVGLNWESLTFSFDLFRLCFHHQLLLKRLLGDQVSHNL